MQINRLLEIVYILLNQKYTTAKQLAERFSGYMKRTERAMVQVPTKSGQHLQPNMP